MWSHSQCSPYACMCSSLHSPYTSKVRSFLLNQSLLALAKLVKVVVAVLVLLPFKACRITVPSFLRSFHPSRLGSDQRVLRLPHDTTEEDWKVSWLSRRINLRHTPRKRTCVCVCSKIKVVVAARVCVRVETESERDCSEDQATTTIACAAWGSFIAATRLFLGGAVQSTSAKVECVNSVCCTREHRDCDQHTLVSLSLSCIYLAPSSG